MKTITTSKQRIGTVDVALHGDWVMRVALSEETPIHSPPELVKPEYVRIRQRASHLYKSTTYTLRYDLTRTWAGTSRTEAEKEQFSNAATCEVELELVAHSQLNVDRFVQSLSMKVDDLVRLVEEGGI